MKFIDGNLELELECIIENAFLVTEIYKNTDNIEFADCIYYEESDIFVYFKSYMKLSLISKNIFDSDVRKYVQYYHCLYHRENINYIGETMNIKKRFSSLIYCDPFFVVLFYATSLYAKNGILSMLPDNTIFSLVKREIIKMIIENKFGKDLGIYLHIHLINQHYIFDNDEIIEIYGFLHLALLQYVSLIINTVEKGIFRINGNNIRFDEFDNESWNTYLIYIDPMSKSKLKKERTIILGDLLDRLSTVPRMKMYVNSLGLRRCMITREPITRYIKCKSNHTFSKDNFMIYQNVSKKVLCPICHRTLKCT